MTNIHKLWEYKEYLNINGNVLTSELITILQNSLTILQVENHFTHVQYWGQIYAIDVDYHIAVGINSDAIEDRKYFYTQDFTFWSLLPKPKKKYKFLSLLAVFPFRGDPTLKLKVVDEALELDDPERCRVLKEENRLAATISNINDEAEICARGQLIKRADGSVVICPNFYGLHALESKQIQTYQHIRQPQYKWNTNLLSRKDYNFSLDFLDTIDQDIPSGCWNLKMEQSGSVVYLRNLYWQGMTYFHKIKTKDAGWLYVGNGRKDWDVPFLL